MRFFVSLFIHVQQSFQYRHEFTIEVFNFDIIWIYLIIIYHRILAMSITLDILGVISWYMYTYSIIYYYKLLVSTLFVKKKQNNLGIIRKLCAFIFSIADELRYFEGY